MRSKFLAILSEVTCLIANPGRLSELTPIKTAFYDADGAASACLPETRVALLADIKKWFMDDSPNHRSIFWLSGIAGTGKTTVSQSVCAMLKPHLGAVFFFSRNSAERRRPSSILPTLIYQLAYKRPAIQEAICDVIAQDPDISMKAVQIQFQKLISEGLMQVRGAGLAPVLFVLDAVDECNKEGGKEGGLFIPLLVSHLSDLPIRIKIFITSRPEASIQKMLVVPTASATCYVLHEIEKGVVQADIERYLRVEFAIIANNHDLAHPWPTHEQLQQLAERADGLFIYASTAIKFVSESIFPTRSLDMFLEANTHTSHVTYATLDNVYMQIICSIPREATGYSSAIFRDVVGAIVVLQQPMSMQGLGKLLQVDINIIRGILLPLYSLLDIKSLDRPIRVFHPSFPDFITNRERCTDTDLLVDVENVHLSLSVQCLTTMNNHLKQNICNIGNTSLLNSEITDLADRRTRHITEELQYACLHWMTHLASLQTVKGVEILVDELDTFCTDHLMHWIEVLSLYQKLRLVVEGLPGAYEWARVCVLS
jgi:ABC-type dipeptide/oligopeptide/nickel transport system ATPase subunit